MADIDARDKKLLQMEAVNKELDRKYHKYYEYCQKYIPNIKERSAATAKK